MPIIISRLGGSGGRVLTSEPSFSNVKLLLPMDGSDGSTTFTDESTTGHTVTAIGDAQVDTAQKVFGTGSCLFDGTGDALEASDHADFNLAANDFEISCRVRFSTINSGFNTFAGQWNSASDLAWILAYDQSSSVLEFDYSINGTATVAVTGKSWSPSTDTWYDIGVFHIGDMLLLTVDGVLHGVATLSGTIHNSSLPLVIGARKDGGGSYGLTLTGWIDEFRLVNGGSRLSGLATDALFASRTTAFPTS